MKKSNRLIVGSALSLAAIAVAIDHTRHRLPEAVPASSVSNTLEQGSMIEEDESPCGMGSESPCGMGSESPCSMDTDDDSSGSPCGLGD